MTILQCKKKFTEKPHKIDRLELHRYMRCCKMYKKNSPFDTSRLLNFGGIPSCVSVRDLSFQAYHLIQKFDWYVCGGGRGGSITVPPLQYS